ncbi:MAG: hypothetical protein GTO16_08910, partial [Candidatus Aminicenantes bacterium]|nr:hypothetical protein [Candidatus Aminicenantes bacterium]
MKARGKKLISLFLIFSLIMISANLYAKERRGAKLIVLRRGDQVQTRYKDTPWETSVTTGIRGELIAVKPNSLLLLDTEGKDVSVGIADIKVIRIVKKSKAFLGAGIGGAAGTLGGVIFAAKIDASEEGEGGEFLAYIFFGAIGLVAGALVGGLIGGLLGGRDKTIQFEGMTDLEIQKALDKLRKKAR